jgi:hypothetical protein
MEVLSSLLTSRQNIAFISIKIDSHEMTIFRVSAFFQDIARIENGRCIPLVDTHILRNKRLKMEDHFASCFAPVFVERGPLDDFGFQLVVRLCDELPCECLDDRCRVNAVGEEIVELGADLEEASWTAFLDDLIRNLRYESFPVWRWNMRELCNVLTAVLSVQRVVSYV